MPEKDTTKLHANLALIIKAHKKKLFRNHRNGMEIYEAVGQFTEKLNQDLVCAIPDDHDEGPIGPKGKPKRAVAIPIIGTVSAEGVKLYADEPDEADKKIARKEARVIANLLEGGGVPDFIFQTVIETVDNAFLYFRDELAKPIEDYDEKNLYPLFLKTKLLGAEDLWSGDERVAFAIREILRLEETPASLFNKVADWVAEAYTGDMREFWDVKTLEHLLEVNKAREEEADNDNETEKANQASA